MEDRRTVERDAMKRKRTVRIDRLPVVARMQKRWRVSVIDPYDGGAKYRTWVFWTRFGAGAFAARMQRPYWLNK